jgi:hypothetical protein
MFKRLVLIALSAITLGSTLSACVVAPARGYYRDGYYHDRDADGVPNRYDRHPGNPYRN